MCVGRVPIAEHAYALGLHAPPHSATHDAVLSHRVPRPSQHSQPLTQCGPRKSLHWVVLPGQLAQSVTHNDGAHSTFAVAHASHRATHCVSPPPVARHVYGRAAQWTPLPHSATHTGAVPLHCKHMGGDRQTGRQTDRERERE